MKKEFFIASTFLLLVYKIIYTFPQSVTENVAPHNESKVNKKKLSDLETV